LLAAPLWLLETRIEAVRLIGEWKLNANAEVIRMFAADKTQPHASRVAAAGWALWFYVGKALWPHPLLIGYPRWDVPLDVWWVYLPGAVWVVMLVAARKHRGLFLAMARAALARSLGVMRLAGAFCSSRAKQLACPMARPRLAPAENPLPVPARISCFIFALAGLLLELRFL